MKFIVLLSVLLLASFSLSKANTFDYVASTKHLTESIGYVSLSPMTYGQSEYLTIAFEFAMDSSASNCIFSLGSGNAILEISVVNGKLNIRDSKFTAVSSIAIEKSKYYHVVIEMKNIGGSSTLKFYLNGADRSSTLNRLSMAPFTNSQRQQNYIGLCPSNPSGVPRTGHVFFNEFKIYGRKLTAVEISNSANPQIRLPPSLLDLVVYYPFDEGTGTVSYGVAGTFALESFTAQFSLYATFSTRLQQGVLKCESTGDPHVTTFTGKYWTPKHVTAHSKFVSCNVDGRKGYFSVNSFHDFGHPSHKTATLNREFKIKYDKTFIKVGVGMNVYKKTGKGQFTKISNVNQDIGDLKLLFSEDKSTLQVFGSPFGYIKIINYGDTHMNIFGHISSTMCSIRDPSYCDNQENFISEIEYEDDVPVPVSPPLADPPHEEYNPCSEDPELSALAVRICTSKFPDTSSPKHKDCVFDICATGDPTIPIIVDEDCIANKRRLILEGKQSEADQLQCQDCNCLYGDCDEATKTCTCFEGYVGPDCSQEKHLLNLTVDHSKTFNNRAVHLSSHFVNIPENSPVASNLGDLNTWAVEDSILVYVSSMRKLVGENQEVRYDYHLYVVGDISSSINDVSLTIPYVVTTTSTPQYSLFRTGENSISSTSANVKFSPYNVNGFVISTLGPEWCVNFDFSGQSLFKQVVVGSGNKLGKLDILKIQNDALSSVKVCGKEIINPCAEYTTCTECMVDEKCGWCRSNQRCLFGNPAGPTEGSSCPRWAYTFDGTVSRRINAEFGVPVSPKKQDVFLVSGSQDLATLPVEITVDMGQSKGSVFDLAIITPEIGVHFGMFRDNLFSTIDQLKDYPSIGISFSTYSANGLAPVTLLESFNRTRDVLTDILKGLAPGQNIDDKPDQALKQIASTKNPRWRVNTRHVALIIASNTEASLSVATIEATRNALLDQAVFPVFAVKNSEVSEYQAFVDNIGFGSVVVLSETGENLASVLADAIDIATKSVSLVPKVAGHILVNDNTEVWNIFGLQPNMRGRMQFPMHKGTSGENLISTLIAPGYGSATIENLKTDKPTATGFDVDMIQEQPLAEQQALRGEIIELSGRALNPSDPIFIKILSFGAPLNESIGLGNFYHLPEDISDITSYDDLTPFLPGQFVDNAAGKIIYVPPTDAFSVSPRLGRLAYTSITYEVYDACTVSDPKTINVYISYENKPPTNEFITPISYENRVTLITLDGHDERLHELTAVVDLAPFQVVDGVLSFVGRLFQYDEAVFQQLSSVYDIYRELDLESILSGLSQIDTNPLSIPVTDSLRRVMFIPDRYTNSEYKPASGFYQRDPIIVYHVEQILNEHDAPGDIGLTSIETAHAFSIKWVNQPPSVTDYGVVVDDSYCTFTEECRFYQNLGTYYPNVPAPTFLNAIVTDIEEEPLFVRVTSVDCPTGAELLGSNGLPVVAGLDIDGFYDDQWSVAFLFSPERDQFGEDYCTITYIGYDGLNTSFDEATITIHIDYLNQPPAGDSARVYAFPDIPTPFNIPVHDYDNSTVYGTIISCELNPDDYNFSLTINDVPIDCSALPAAFGGVSMTMDSVYPGVYSGNSTGVLTCHNCVELPYGLIGLLWVEYDDGFDRVNFTKSSYMIELSFVNVNQPPVFYRTGDEINNSTNYFKIIETKIPTQGGNVNPNVDANITIYDADMGPYYGRLIYQITPEVENGAYLFNSLGEDMFDYVEFITNPTRTSATIEGNLINLNHVLSHYRILSSVDGVYNLTYTFNDYSNSGACNIGDPNPCEKIAVGVLQFTATNTNRIGGVIAGATAAGAVVLGGAALALAWMKFKKLRAPAEGPNPWLLDDNGDEVIDNPMYIQRGGESENPLYETAVNDS